MEPARLVTYRRVDMLTGSKLDRVRSATAEWLVRNRRTAVLAGCGALVLLAAALGVGFGLAVATFAVVVYGAVFAGVTMLGVTPLKALPSLQVGLWVDGELTRSYAHRTDRLRAPIDIDACVRNAVAEVNRTVPPEPPKPNPLVESLGLGLYQQSAMLGATESRNKAVERLGLELQTYAAQLRQWLEAFASRRQWSYGLIRRDIAVHNGGESVADGIILRLHMPPAIVAMTDKRLETIQMSPPPVAPQYEQRSALWQTEKLLDIVRPSFPGFPVTPTLGPGAAGPSWTREQSHDVAEVRLDRLTHGVTELTRGTLEILPREPGISDIAWDAHVGNLRRPARGTIRIELDPMPEDGEPLTTLGAVLQTGDVEIKGEVDYRP